MNAKLPALEAARNLHSLSENPYPGRGFVVGCGQNGDSLVQVYWIMGRSENSRNRILKAEDGKVFTEFADPSKGGDPELVIYNAMDEVVLQTVAWWVVSNGYQTDTATGCGRLDSDKMSGWLYEPDKPNFTSRITGLSWWNDRNACASILVHRKSPFNDSCERHLSKYLEIAPGFGYCVTTYGGDGDPLPHFKGEPLLMPLAGDIEEILDTFWNSLNDSNRVAIAAKVVSLDRESKILIRNKYEQV